jgi:hypothetical protein
MREATRKRMTCSISLVLDKYLVFIPELNSLLKDIPNIPKRYKSYRHTELGAIHQYLEFKFWYFKKQGSTDLEFFKEWEDEVNIPNQYSININRKSIYGSL